MLKLFFEFMLLEAKHRIPHIYVLQGIPSSTQSGLYRNSIETSKKLEKIQKKKPDLGERDRLALPAPPTFELKHSDEIDNGGSIKVQIRDVIRIGRDVDCWGRSIE